MTTSTLSDSFHTIPSGFVVVHNGRMRSFQDQDVLGVRQRLEPSESSGFEDGGPEFQEGVRQSLEVLVADGDEAEPEWLTVAHDLDLDAPSRSIDSFRDRIVENLELRAWNRIRSGWEFEGGPWTLSHSALVDTETGHSILPQEIARYEWRGDELWIWHEDAQATEDAPVLRFPRGAANSQLLFRLLQHMLPEAPVVQETLPTTGLGKWLGQLELANRIRHAPWLTIGLAGVIGLLALDMLLPGAFAPGLLVLLIATLLVLPRLQGRSEQLDHYERGLLWECESQQRLVRYEQMLGYSINSTPPSLMRELGMAGLLIRPEVRMRFLLEDALPLDLALPSPPNAKQRREAARLHQQTTRVLAERMGLQLEQHAFVAWTHQVAFVPQGLLCVPDRNGERRMVDFARIAKWELTDRQLTLQLADGEPPVLLSTSEPNFYPGLLLAQKLGVAPGGEVLPECLRPHRDPSDTHRSLD